MDAAISITDEAAGPKLKARGGRPVLAAVSPRARACQVRRPKSETSVTAPENSKSGAAGAPAGDRALHAHWMARVAQGDRRAFAELFAHFAPRLKSYLLRLGLEAPQAEEVAQEVMIAVWRKADSFDPSQAGVTTWIFRIARNRRIDAFRREHKADFDPDDPILQPQAETPPDAALDAAAREAEVRAALADLTEDQQRLVRQAIYEDLSHSQIASKTGLPLGTVKSRLRLAFSKLKISLVMNGSEGGRS
jgi:RNA polymerase sigma-70 factor (ECF subfamily)